MKRVADKIRQNISLRKGDMVRVMRGKDREEFHNKSARVLSVDLVKMRVTVEHAHMIKRHMRPNPAKNIKGGIVEREGPIHISNVMLVCPACNKPTRVGYKVEFVPEKVTLKDGTVAERRKRRLVGRICRRCDATLDK